MGATIRAAPRLKRGKRGFSPQPRAGPRAPTRGKSILGQRFCTTVSPAARALLPLVGADLWFTGEPVAPGTPERQRQDALALLANWDGAMNEHLPEPLIYSAWMRQLQDRLIHDELGALAAAFPDAAASPDGTLRLSVPQDGKIAALSRVAC